MTVLLMQYAKEIVYKTWARLDPGYVRCKAVIHMVP